MKSVEQKAWERFLLSESENFAVDFEDEDGQQTYRAKTAEDCRKWIAFREESERYEKTGFNVLNGPYRIQMQSTQSMQKEPDHSKPASTFGTDFADFLKKLVQDFETQVKADPGGDDVRCMKEIARFLYKMDIGFTLGKHPELIKPMQDLKTKIMEG